LGGHLDECTDCGYRPAISYNSCRDRHCPKCQANARDRWLEARRKELLPTRYVHVVFTLPHELAPLALQNKKLLYDLLLQTHRLVSLVDDQLTFRWRERPHHNEPKLMTLSHDEFLRRFLLHLLPRGFIRIRHFGFLANRRRATLLPLCFQLLGPIPQPQIEPAAFAAEQPSPLCRCPKCGGTMVIIQTLTAAQILLRSPPSFLRAA
jgi:hypothetical protein